MIRRPCASMGCGRLVVPPHRYCDKHLTPASRGIVAGKREGNDAKAYARATMSETDKSAARWDAHHAAHPEWSDMYHSSAWRKLRATHLNANPYCAMCPDVATTVDHIIEHRGDEGLFLDAGNLQSLCKRCHDKKSARGRG